MLARDGSTWPRRSARTPPTGTPFDRILDEEDQAAHVDVLPLLWSAGQRPQRTPGWPAPHRGDVDAGGEQDLLLLPGDRRGARPRPGGRSRRPRTREPSGAACTPRSMSSGVQPGDMAVDRHGVRRRRGGIEHSYPRVPGAGVRGIHRDTAARVPAAGVLRELQDGEAVPQLLALETTASRNPVRTVAATLGFASSGAASRATSSIVARPLSPDPRLVDVGIAPMKSSSPIAAAPSWPPVAAT